ncbi:MAG: hypothetical protein ACR2PF_14110 [Rhizobiaceae bacterium]
MNDDHDEEPLDPQVEAIRRKMMRLLMISSGTMMIGLMAVLLAIVYKVTSGTSSVPVAAANEIALPENAAIIDTALSGDRIMLTLKMPDGSREIRVHSADGKLSATYSISEE